MRVALFTIADAPELNNFLKFFIPLILSFKPEGGAEKALMEMEKIRQTFRE